MSPSMCGLLHGHLLTYYPPRYSQLGLRMASTSKSIQSHTLTISRTSSATQSPRLSPCGTATLAREVLCRTVSSSHQTQSQSYSQNIGPFHTSASWKRLKLTACLKRTSLNLLRPNVQLLSCSTERRMETFASVLTFVVSIARKYITPIS